MVFNEVESSKNSAPHKEVRRKTTILNIKSNYYLIKFRDAAINIINEKFFIVENSRTQKYIRYPSSKSSLYVFGENDCWVNFERQLPKEFRIKGVTKWAITPMIMRKVYAKTNKIESSDISVSNSHNQQLARRHKLIKILYSYFIFIFKAKYAQIPENRKNTIITQIIYFSFYAFKLLTAYFNQLPTEILTFCI